VVSCILPGRPGRLVLAAALALAVGPAGPAPAFAQTSAALDSAARAHAGDSTVAGVAVAVVRGADTLLLDGYGHADLEHDVPTPPDAVYEIGSVTKQFTAAAVLQLAEKDSLDLDAEITDYLEDFDTRGHTVTVRDLLHHTSGIRSYTSMAAFGELGPKELPRDTLLSLVEAEPFDFAPGTAMIYNNTGYFLLGLVIEEVSGQDYAEYLEDHLFGPAGMEDSYYCDERAVVERRAHGYAWAGPEAGFRQKSYLNHTWPYAAGSLCSTAGDLVAWNQALHGGRILSDASHREMITPGRLRDGTELRYAMGLAVPEEDGRRVIRHGGGIFGYLSDARYYPDEELVVVVLQNNTGPTGPGALADSLVHMVLGPGEEPAAGGYEGDLTAFTGTYAGRVRGRTTSVEVTVEDGGLVVRGPGRDPEVRPLEHVSGLTWRDGGDRFTFVRAGDRIVELRMDVVSGHYVLRPAGGR
jgi:CubicO group peptidase (beta-lactamase class C family)